MPTPLMKAIIEKQIVLMRRWSLERLQHRKTIFRKLKDPKCKITTKATNEEII